MPVKSGKDKKGHYYRWGSRGKKYYYKKGNEASRKRAETLAGKQGAAAHASGYKGNVMKLQKITANFTGMVRHDTMEGRDFVVAPMIMIVEGVHKGSEGPVFYPEKELAKTPAMWNWMKTTGTLPRFTAQR